MKSPATRLLLSGDDTVFLIQPDGVGDLVEADTRKNKFLVLPLHLPLWPLLPGGQHGAVVRDCVVHAKEQHVFLTWS